MLEAHARYLPPSCRLDIFDTSRYIGFRLLAGLGLPDQHARLRRFHYGHGRQRRHPLDSLVHGYPFADVCDVGSKVLVIAKKRGAGLSLDQVRMITHPGEVDPESESLIGSYAIDEFLEEKIEIMIKWRDWLDRLPQSTR
ncbi:MAG: hypothetical protein WDN48_19865 [Pseudolabrys sp.]